MKKGQIDFEEFIFCIHLLGCHVSRKTKFWPFDYVRECRDMKGHGTRDWGPPSRKDMGPETEVTPPQEGTWDQGQGCLPPARSGLTLPDRLHCRRYASCGFPHEYLIVSKYMI